jgi:hypothetical protein
MPRRPPYAAPAVEAALSILETIGTVHEAGARDLATPRLSHRIAQERR